MRKILDCSDSISLLLKFFSYLDYQDLIHVMKSCHLFMSLGTSDSLWKNLTFSNFELQHEDLEGQCPNPQQPPLYFYQKSDWRHVFSGLLSSGGLLYTLSYVKTKTRGQQQQQHHSPRSSVFSTSPRAATATAGTGSSLSTSAAGTFGALAASPPTLSASFQGLCSPVLSPTYSSPNLSPVTLSTGRTAEFINTAEYVQTMASRRIVKASGNLVLEFGGNYVYMIDNAKSPGRIRLNIKKLLSVTPDPNASPNGSPKAPSPKRSLSAIPTSFRPRTKSNAETSPTLPHGGAAPTPAAPTTSTKKPSSSILRRKSAKADSNSLKVPFNYNNLRVQDTGTAVQVYQYDTDHFSVLLSSGTILRTVASGAIQRGSGNNGGSRGSGNGKFVSFFISHGNYSQQFEAVTKFQLSSSTFGAGGVRQITYNLVLTTSKNVYLLDGTPVLLGKSITKIYENNKHDNSRYSPAIPKFAAVNSKGELYTCYHHDDTTTAGGAAAAAAATKFDRDPLFSSMQVRSVALCGGNFVVLTKNSQVYTYGAINEMYPTGDKHGPPIRIGTLSLNSLAATAGGGSYSKSEKGADNHHASSPEGEDEVAEAMEGTYEIQAPLDDDVLSKSPNNYATTGFHLFRRSPRERQYIQPGWTSPRLSPRLSPRATAAGGGASQGNGGGATSRNALANIGAVRLISCTEHNVALVNTKNEVYLLGKTGVGHEYIKMPHKIEFSSTSFIMSISPEYQRMEESSLSASGHSIRKERVAYIVLVHESKKETLLDGAEEPDEFVMCLHCNAKFFKDQNMPECVRKKHTGSFERQVTPSPFGGNSNVKNSFPSWSCCGSEDEKSLGCNVQFHTPISIRPGTFNSINKAKCGIGCIQS